MTVTVRYDPVDPVSDTWGTAIYDTPGDVLASLSCHEGGTIAEWSRLIWEWQDWASWAVGRWLLYADRELNVLYPTEVKCSGQRSHATLWSDSRDSVWRVIVKRKQGCEIHSPSSSFDFETRTDSVIFLVWAIQRRPFIEYVYCCVSPALQFVCLGSV